MNHGNRSSTVRRHQRLRIRCERTLHGFGSILLRLLRFSNDEALNASMNACSCSRICTSDLHNCSLTKMLIKSYRQYILIPPVHVWQECLTDLDLISLERIVLEPRRLEPKLLRNSIRCRFFYFLFFSFGKRIISARSIPAQRHVPQMSSCPNIKSRQLLRPRVKKTHVQLLQCIMKQKNKECSTYR